MLAAYHKEKTLTAAAKKLGIAKSTASVAVAKLKNTPEYQEVIQPKLDRLRLELAAIALANTAKVKKSLQVIPLGWDYIKSFGTIVDKVAGLGDRGGAQIGVRVDVRMEEQRERWKDSLKFTPAEVVDAT